MRGLAEWASQCLKTSEKKKLGDMHPTHSVDIFLTYFQVIANPTLTINPVFMNPILSHYDRVHIKTYFYHLVI